MTALPSRRRPAPQSRARLQPRDYEILAWVTRHGVVTLPQIAATFFPDVTPKAAENRVRDLVAEGRRERYLLRDLTAVGAVYRASARGVREAKVGLGPVNDLHHQALSHDLDLVDLSEQLLAEFPGSVFITQRELRAALYRRRLQARPRTLEIAGRDVTLGRDPDGLLVVDDEQVLAVELELTPKRPYDRYDAIFDAYSLRTSGLDCVRWYVRDPARKASGDAALWQALQRRIADHGVEGLVQLRRWTARHLPGMSHADRAAIAATTTEIPA